MFDTVQLILTRRENGFTPPGSSARPQGAGTQFENTPETVADFDDFVFLELVLVVHPRLPSKVRCRRVHTFPRVKVRRLGIGVRRRRWVERVRHALQLRHARRS